jgi:hypothetical protein
MPVVARRFVRKSRFVSNPAERRTPPRAQRQSGRAGMAT